MPTLSKLTSPGIAAFSRLIRDAKRASTAEIDTRLLELLDDSALVQLVDPGIELSDSELFADKLELARYLDRVLPQIDVTTHSYPENTGIFSWLAAVYFRQVAKSTSGSYRLLTKDKYVLASAKSEYYRHLVAGPVWIYRRLGLRSRLFLSNNVCHEHPDVIEQLASRSYVMNYPTVVESLDELYWDPERATYWVGASGANEPSSFRNYEKFLAQLSRNYDLSQMTAGEIISMLPPEFDRARRLGRDPNP